MCNFNSETSPKADNTPKALRISAFPLREKGSNYIMGGFLVIEDITENANIKMSLADMEQLATLGKMTTKIAHELNNPLDGILRYLNLATRSIEFENIEKPKEYIEQCRKGITRMINIVQELLQFSRTSYAPLELISLEKIIDDALTIMEPNIHAANVEVFKKYCTPTPNVKAGNLFQVFCNLVKNALDAMGAGGKLEISISMKDSQNVIVKFTDTGHGIKTENIDLIFKPFFTTKEHGKGTGLGLAICKDIIENYRGSIHAENSPTGGSIFTINLPTGI
jgi:C4-dicarboxylate-specific signal transduction histidine kinase